MAERTIKFRIVGAVARGAEYEVTPGRRGEFIITARAQKPNGREAPEFTFLGDWKDARALGNVGTFTYSIDTPQLDCPKCGGFGWVRDWEEGDRLGVKPSDSVEEGYPQKSCEFCDQYGVIGQP